MSNNEACVIVIKLISVFIHVPLVYTCINLQYSQKKKPKIYFVIWFGISTLVFALCQLYITSFIVTVILNIFLYYILTTFYKSTAKRRILVIFYTYLFMVACEGIGLLVGYIGRSILNEVQTAIIELIVTRLLVLCIVQVIARRKYIKDSFGFSKPSIWFLLIGIPVLSMSMIVFSARNITDKPFDSLASIVLIILINLLAFLLYDELAKLHKEQIEVLSVKDTIAHYEKQLSSINQYQDDTQILLHDLNNTLLVISSALKKGEFAKAEALLDELVQAEENIKEFSNTGLVEIDSLINYKLSIAKQKGVKIALSVLIPNELFFSTSDIVAILGNVLDNSLEAVGTGESDPFINLKMQYSKYTLTIIIKNSFWGNRKKKIDGYISTKENNDRHGCGLVSVKKIAGKYDGYVECSDENNIFTTKILLFENPR